MRKVLIMLCALCVGFAYADNVPENKIVSSKEYVDSAIADTQPMLNANNTDLTNNVIVYTNAAGTVTNKPVSTTLTNNAALPTVSAVNSGLDAKQYEVGIINVLPSGYTQLEYIESTGTQYIDTGIVENTIDYMEMDFENKTSNGFMFVNGSTQLGVLDSRYGTTEQNKRYKIKQELSNNKWQFTNITNGTVYTQSYNTGTSKLWLFRLNNGGFASAKIYNFLCSASGVVRCNLVPARRNSDGEVGMYDTVTGTFFNNSGTGTFIAGPVPIIGAMGMVVTYTETPGTLGEKGIYQDTGTYAEQKNSLVDAGTFNTALAGALDSEFVCANRPDAYDPVTGNCWLWEISSVSILPSGYTELEYIESTGTQYIDTGIVENTIDYMEMDFENKTSNGFMFVNGSTQLGVVDSRYGTTEQNKRYKIKQELSNNKWQFTNITNGTVYTQSYNTGTSKLWLFRLNNGGGFASVKIYNFLCSAAGVLRCNLIPVRRDSDDVVGMYDKVTGTFFTNAGTGAFIAGPTITYLPQNQNAQNP